MKQIFITFGSPSFDPSQNYYDAVARICNQAKEFNVFDEIIGYTDKDLKNDSEFWDKHKDFIENNKRGYGYYLWKPYLILKTLEKMNDGDILLYLDAGCEMNSSYKKNLLNLFKIVQQKKIIGNHSMSDDIRYTKADLTHFLSMNNDPKLKDRHMQAGVVMMTKCDMIVRLYKECYEIGSNNYHFIDDSPSKIHNDPKFIEHRHDQSIFNLLVKKYNLLNHDIPTSRSNAIWDVRNRTGKSKI